MAQHQQQHSCVSTICTAWRVENPTAAAAAAEHAVKDSKCAPVSSSQQPACRDCCSAVSRVQSLVALERRRSPRDVAWARVTCLTGPIREEQSRECQSSAQCASDAKLALSTSREHGALSMTVGRARRGSCPGRAQLICVSSCIFKVQRAVIRGTPNSYLRNKAHGQNAHTLCTHTAHGLTMPHKELS